MTKSLPHGSTYVKYINAIAGLSSGPLVITECMHTYAKRSAMEFEWDERKRAQLIAERALDFASAPLFFDGRAAIHQPTPRNGEERWKTTARMQGGFFTIVWTWRGETIRVISMRRAHEQEIRKFRQAHGR